MFATFVAMELVFLANYRWRLGLFKGDPKHTVVVGFVFMVGMGLYLWLVPKPDPGRGHDEEPE